MAVAAGEDVAVLDHGEDVRRGDRVARRAERRVARQRLPAGGDERAREGARRGGGGGGGGHGCVFLLYGRFI